MYYLTPAEGKLNPRKSALKSLLKLGYLGLEPRTYRLKAEYSTIELATLIILYYTKILLKQKKSSLFN